MSEISNFEYSEKHVIRESVPAEEYQQALEAIRAFVQKDVTQVVNLTALADVTRDLGSALQAVVLSKGAITPQKTTRPAPFEHGGDEDGVVPVLRVEGGDARLMLKAPAGTVTLRAWEGHTSWEDTDMDKEHFIGIEGIPETEGDSPSDGAYEVTMLANRPIDIPGRSLLDTLVSAREQKQGQWVSYQPRKHPANTQVIRNYVRVLETAAKDVLSSNLPPSTKVPAAFYE